MLDSSFWSAAVHVGVDAYLPLYYQRPLMVPTAVVDEVERGGQQPTTRLREDQQCFRLWLEDKRLAIQDPSQRYPLFGSGEANGLSLALEQRGTVLLVNELRCFIEAVRLGIRAVAVPEIFVRLVRDGRIARARGLTMLDILDEATGAQIIDRARRAIGEETQGS